MKQDELFKSLKPLDYKSGQEMALKNRICKEAEWPALAGYGRISKELREKRWEREEQEGARLAKKLFLIMTLIIVVSSLLGVWEY